MTNGIQNLFFRTKDNGAAVYRVDMENRQKRLELIHIANVNIRNGEIKPHGQEAPTASETNEIDAWVVERRKTLNARAVDDVHRLMDQIAQTTQWFQSSATNAHLEELSDKLLMSMHDLRVTIVRKNSDRILNKR